MDIFKTWILINIIMVANEIGSSVSVSSRRKSLRKKRSESKMEQVIELLIVADFSVYEQ